MTTYTANRRFEPRGSSRHAIGRSSTGGFAVVCLFSAAGLIVTALAFALIGFDELGRVLAMAG